MYRESQLTTNVVSQFATSVSRLKLVHWLEKVGRLSRVQLSPHLIALAFLALAANTGHVSGQTSAQTLRKDIQAEPKTANESPFLKSLNTDSLVAWCIVPFDAKKRSPAERAAMLSEIGMKRCAYDWREEHVPTFEQEILEYKKRKIEFFAFWGEHPQAFALFEKHDIHPQIWRMMPNPPSGTDEEKAEAAAKGLVPLAKRTRELGCKLGIYNHGGWSGEPENMAAVCRWLRKQGYEHVGIVYNFHHGHEHIEDWSRHWNLIRPYVHCLNLNGMNAKARPKILGIAKGEHELSMLEVVRESGYTGPFGILDHRQELDSKLSLEENLNGMAWIRAELAEPGSGGLKPVATRPAGAAASHNAAQFAGQRVVQGKASYRQPPLAITCKATLDSKSNYNILVANETKQSASHWELFTVRGSGQLSFYLPGSQPDHVHSNVDICDGRPHVVQCIYEATRIRLFIDQKQVADTKVKRVRPGSSAGGLGIGRLVEGGLGCSGHIDWVHLEATASPSPPGNASPKKSSSSIGLWEFPRNTHSGHATRAPHTGFAANDRPVRPYDAAWVREFALQAMEHGDAQRGARVFATAKFACISCHQVLEQGGLVGPRLDKDADKRKPEDVVESLFWPRRKVAKEFVVWQLVNDDGERLQGYRLPSEDGEIALQDPATLAISRTQKDSVVALKEVGTLMPDGLAFGMSEQQQLDVIKFVLDAVDFDGPQKSQIALALKHAQQHQPVAFEYERAPLRPSDWPHATHPVNRDRVYDFYAKQAEHFRKMATLPMMVQAFPGLDGGKDGHWGNQNEQTWADDRWNHVRLGSVQCGVFHGAGKTIARGVCVRLAGEGSTEALSVCFDPDTLTYAAAWKGGFVKFSSVRHGFMHGLRMDGQLVELGPAELGVRPAKPYTYLGYYRRGKEIAFSYRIGEVEYLDWPRVVDGGFVRHVAPQAEHPWNNDNLKGKAWPAQWPERLERSVQKGVTVEGKAWPYVIDTFELPSENPWNIPVFCSGHDFTPDGEAIVCTMHGDVWRITDNGTSATWRRIASGLHQPQGVVVHEDQIYVQCRDQLTRLHDLNDDQEADFYHCFSNAFATSPAGHDFICGLERDAQGRFYTASGNQGLLRISADGSRADVLATGFRNPDGLGLRSDGLITVPCSEGGWTPASQICAVRSSEDNHDAPYFGWGGPKDGRPDLPMVYLPRGLDNSSGGQVEVTGTRWGPLEGKMLHLSFGAGRHFLLLEDQVGETIQGAVVPLPGDFASGIHRGRFNAADGQLYVSGMAGWGSYTPADGCFQRVRYLGGVVQAPLDFHVHRNGVLVKFSEPLTPGVSDQVRSHFAQCWNYRYSGGYGSPEYSPSHPGAIGHDPLSITRAVLLNDGRDLFLELPALQRCSQLHLRLAVDAHAAVDLFATVHELDEDFRQYAEYQPMEKLAAPHPMDSDLAVAAQKKPNPWQKAVAGSRQIRLETAKNLSFATRQIKAKAGEKLELLLVNPDVVPHNWALVRPGALVEVGQMANQLIADPNAYARQYIPQSDKVLAYTDVVPPGTEFRIFFTAPADPGHYPYLCTFPGHWMVMNGVFVVQ